MILLNAIWKVKNSYEKKFMMKHFMIFFLDKVTKLCLYPLLRSFIIIWKEMKYFHLRAHKLAQKQYE